jgi:hypothetical protein
MVKSIVIAACLAIASSASFSQASAPEGASAPAPSKHKIVNKYRAAKARHPAASTADPEKMPDKKGGN